MNSSSRPDESFLSRRISYIYVRMSLYSAYSRRPSTYDNTIYHQLLFDPCRKGGEKICIEMSSPLRRMGRRVKTVAPGLIIDMHKLSIYVVVVVYFSLDTHTRAGQQYVYITKVKLIFCTISNRCARISGERNKKKCRFLGDLTP